MLIALLRCFAKEDGFVQVEFNIAKARRRTEDRYADVAFVNPLVFLVEIAKGEERGQRHKDRWRLPCYMFDALQILLDEQRDAPVEKLRELCVWGWLVSGRYVHMVCMRPIIHDVNADSVVMTGAYYDEIDGAIDLCSGDGFRRAALWCAAIARASDNAAALGVVKRSVSAPSKLHTLPGSDSTSGKGYKNVETLAHALSLTAAKSAGADKTATKSAGVDKTAKSTGGAVDSRDAAVDRDAGTIVHRIGEGAAMAIIAAVAKQLRYTLTFAVVEGPRTWVWAGSAPDGTQMAIVLKTGRHDTNELDVLSSLANVAGIPRVVASARVDEHTYWMVQPWLFAEEPGACPASPAMALVLLRDVARVLAVLHGAHLVHRDVKPSALRFDWEAQLWCLIDYDLVDVLDSRGRTAAAGTKGFMAPECVGNNGYNTPASDMWSLGRAVTVLYQPCLTVVQESHGATGWPYVLSITKSLMRLEEAERPTAAGLEAQLTRALALIDADRGGSRWPMRAAMYETRLERENPRTIL
eukprot:Opistho-1_new@16819